MNSVALRNIARKLPVARSAWHSTPPYHVGSVLENRLGLQIFRVLSKRLTRSLRGRRASEAVKQFVEVLEKDGVLVLPDFLESDQFKAVVEEFDATCSAAELAPYKNVRNARLYRKQLRVADSPELFPTIRATFHGHVILDEIVSAVIRRPVRNPPEILLDTYQCLDETGDDNDIENILHADLHVPTVKMFFYLRQADETNGAFVYAKGSHKLSLTRLLHEYDLSVREAKLNEGRDVDPALIQRRSSEVRNIIRPAYRRRMKVTETQVCVDANTLVIANNMGFHRRGEFTSKTPRKALLINYRNAEPALW